MRSLWTAASGMIAQQTNVDNISNNIANANTVGYKKQSTEFSTLLYSKLQREVTDNNGDPKPVIGQVGAGVRVSGLVTRYTQGNLMNTGNTYDMAIDGEGFFMIQMPDGETSYTRNGSFSLGLYEGGVALTNSAGYPVLNSDGEAIVFDEEMNMSDVYVDEYGRIMLADKESGTADYLMTIGLAQFNNPSGLEKLSGSLLKATENSGEARLETEDEELKKSTVRTGWLEGSNVESIDEIVNLIVAQRAYEMNSKAITAADTMLQQANNLRQ